jgi:decaprenylphospho-beta-D-erythro-pentofuranosid-2-ulose 2-reductase
MKKILIVGATSAIATACARIWAGQGAALFLVGRNPAKLQSIADDLAIRGAASVHRLAADANDIAAHGTTIESAVHALGGIDIALIAHGSLPDQSACEADAGQMLGEIATNGTSVLALLTVLANHFEQQRSGAIGVITSVAGDRGRPSNYVYGSAKAAVQTFCEGLRARLFRAGVSLTDIRPGFVATPMTQGLKLPGPLVAQPAAVARRITAGIERRADVLYTPGYWSLIMLVIKCIPRAVFKRLKL